MFDKFKVNGEKYKDYLAFCKVAEIIKRGHHLTLDGLEQIKLIKS